MGVADGFGNALIGHCHVISRVEIAQPRDQTFGELSRGHVRRAQGPVLHLIHFLASFIVEVEKPDAKRGHVHVPFAPEVGVVAVQLQSGNKNGDTVWCANINGQAWKVARKDDEWVNFKRR